MTALKLVKLDGKREDLERAKEMKQKETTFLKDQLVNMETRYKNQSDQLKEAEKKITNLEGQLNNMENQVSVFSHHISQRKNSSRDTLYFCLSV